MPELADIFRDWGGRYPRALSTEQRRAIHDISACRTPAIGGGALYSCPDCGAAHFAWLSCGNRHCPKCGNDKTTRWLAKRQAEILPVDYYMVTFTLPSELRGACLRHPREIHGAFFPTAAAALKELALDKRFLGAQIGMLGVLQTWRRDGEFHPHIHFLVPGGGLTKDGKYWVFPKNRGFLVATKPLMKLFKGKFKARLEELGLAGIAPPAVWDKNWVGDCKNVGDGMSSFKYLGAYTQRVFIGDKRVEAYDGENVTFRYNQSGDNKAARRTMSALAFMIMFLRHVLPSGFQKTRYYGLLGSARKEDVRNLRLMILTSRGQAPAEPEAFVVPPVRCPRCGAEMRLIDIWPRGPPPRTSGL